MADYYKIRLRGDKILYMCVRGRDLKCMCMYGDTLQLCDNVVRFEHVSMHIELTRFIVSEFTEAGWANLLLNIDFLKHCSKTTSPLEEMVDALLFTADDLG